MAPPVLSRNFAVFWRSFQMLHKILYFVGSRKMYQKTLKKQHRNIEYFVKLKFSEVLIKKSWVLIK